MDRHALRPPGAFPHASGTFSCRSRLLRPEKPRPVRRSRVFFEKNAKFPVFLNLALDNRRFSAYNIKAFGVWRSLVSRLVRDQEASGSNPDTPTILTKRYRCVWRKARRINRFRAFSSPDFFSQTIDANRCFRASAPIRTGDCLPSDRCIQPVPFFSGDFSGWQRHFSQKRITKTLASFCWS